MASVSTPGVVSLTSPPDSGSIRASGVASAGGRRAADTLLSMSARRLLTPRWVIAHVVVAIIVAVLVALGFWQLSRYGQESAAADKLESRLDADPVPLGDLVSPGLDAADADALEYRQVTATGSYEPADEVLVRSQSYQGTSGYHVLTPLVLDSGYAVLVNRGWVPFELDVPPITEALPPGGRIQVTGFLERSQVRGEGFGPRDPAEGRLERVFFKEVSRIQQQVDQPLLPMLVQLTEQTPQQQGRLPIAAPPPTFDPTQNLSYAGQWFFFAAIALIGYGFIVVRQIRGAGDEKAEVRAPIEHSSLR